LNWGDPRTLQRIWWHLTGQQYQSYFSFSPAELGNQAVAFGRHAAHEFGPWWCPAGLVLIAIGCGALFRRDGVLLAFLALLAACDVAYTLGYAIAEDMDAYYLPTYIAATIAAGAGASQVLRWAHARAARWPRAPLVTAAALLLVPVVALAGNFLFNDRSRYWIAQDYVDNILRTIEPNGMLLTLDWQVCSPFLYTRAISRQRRDVTVIDINLLRRSWYFAYLRREYPDLMQQTRDEVDAFLEDLTQWEQDPERYQRVRALNERIDTRFRDMIIAFVREHLRTGPVYITQDIALNRSAQDFRLTQALAAAYQLVPQGLVFELVRERTFHDPAEPLLVTRGLADGTLRFEPDDVVRQKVFPVYVSMLYNRGRYLSLFGQHARAIEAFKRAVALDPSFAPAQSALAASMHALRVAEPDAR
jgi:tetratricopeptide (TPR) repeat protein